MRKFRWAYHLKDHNDRTLHQAVQAAGPNAPNKNDVILASLTDDQIRTKDPMTTLYPFSAMAIGKHANLDITFYLLRRRHRLWIDTQDLKAVVVKGEERKER